MLTKKKPFPGDQEDQKLIFPKMGAKPLKKKGKENAKNAKKPGDKKEDKKKSKGSKWAKKAALSLVKKG